MENFHQEISQLYKSACVAELAALKPGNVHIFADGHGMTMQDFVKSAEVVTAIIAQPDLSLGQRIFLSVEATHKAVACNTNLGIILLCAPLIHAVITVKNGTLRQRLQQVLEQTSVTDAQFTFDAIALAKPAGLGVASQHDVHQAADCNMLQAMQSAAERDLIALQYTNSFEAIFNVSLPILAQINADNIPLNQTWLTTRLYLNLLATFPDSHIVRKYGATVAGQVQQQAKEHLANFNLSVNPKTYQRQLLDWDIQLKHQGINPGTSADLTVASLLAYELTKLTLS